MTASIPRHTQGQRVGGLRYSTKVTAVSSGFTERNIGVGRGPAESMWDESMDGIACGIQEDYLLIKRIGIWQNMIWVRTRENIGVSTLNEGLVNGVCIAPGNRGFLWENAVIVDRSSTRVHDGERQDGEVFHRKTTRGGSKRWVANATHLGSNINEFQTLRRERRGRSRFSHFRENGEPLRGLAVGRKDPGISCVVAVVRVQDSANKEAHGRHTINIAATWHTPGTRLMRRDTETSRVIHGLSGGWYLQRKHQVRVSKIAGYGKAFAREPQVDSKRNGNALMETLAKREAASTGKIGVVHALDLFKVVDQDDGDVYWGALSVGFGRAVGRRTARASHRCHLLSPTTTSSFLVRSTHLGMTQDTLEDLYDKLSCKTGTGCAAQRRRTEYTIFVWRQQQPPSDTTSTSSAVASSVDQTIWRRHGQSTFGSPGICTLNPGNSLENTAFRASLLWDVIQLFLDERRTSLPLLRLYGRMPIQTLSRAAVLLVAAFMLPSSGLDLSVRVARSGFFESHFKKTGGELNVLAGKGGGRAKPPK
ncbi:hypothetical protein FB45DRAFT_868069 [Roridomyces roridus]|uniref:Uncharacterized protein n=1 Tax=Roridomyces roridus TaxID=1738132 RepID=A0AAD7FIS2_9AGAR|nr:hypothetical protein FB45DRAFT_868069 [Roridomyces roridus]